jgi:hypothetical protein
MLRETLSHAGLTLYHLSLDIIRFLGSLVRSRSALTAENLFLRKQLALYQERQVRPRRATDAARLTDRSQKWQAPILDAPAGRRDEFVDRYFKRAKVDQVVCILKAREPVFAFSVGLGLCVDRLALCCLRPLHPALPQTFAAGLGGSLLELHLARCLESHASEAAHGRRIPDPITCFSDSPI